MRRRLRLPRTRIAALALVAAIAVPVSATPAGAENSRPHLDLIDLDGTRQTLDAFDGKIVVLNFWATWCFPCREEMPLLEKLSREYMQRGVEFIAASTDDESTIELIPAAIGDGRYHV